MKKNIYIAVACFALAACQITEIDSPNTGGEPNAFQKGQQVTLKVSSGDETKAVGTLNGATKGIDFTWETGDKILVKVGDKSAEFTLKGEGGSKVGYFVGEMPAEGNNFDVQYPVTTPDLTSQTYSSTAAIPHDMMLATATGCTVGSAFTLKPQYAVLRLNLYGYDREITKIAVNNITASETYTLTCSTAVQVGPNKEYATKFFVVVPAGSFEFKVYFTSDAINGLEPTVHYVEGSNDFGVGTLIVTRKLSSSSEKTFSSGIVYNLPATSLTTIWAPFNCGYDETNYPAGIYYQWGRKYGQSYYKLESVPKSNKITTRANNIAEGNTSDNKEKIYIKTDDWVDNSWFNNPSLDDEWISEYSPCPSGWRLPILQEFEAIVYGLSTTTLVKNVDIYGFWFNGTDTPGTNGVFFPAAGNRTTNGYGIEKDISGSYWVKEHSPNIKHLGRNYTFNTESKGAVADTNFSYVRGNSVRCVQDIKAVHPGATLPDDMQNVAGNW